MMMQALRKRYTPVFMQFAALLEYPKGIRPQKKNPTKSLACFYTIRIIYYVLTL